MEKEYIRSLTESGDYYSATAEMWKIYRDAVNNNDWDTAQPLEEGANDDFYYDP